ncbi:MAG TPA: response regulator [Myxococcota bacterium]|nr:response regulator [Myxococcota bacterium]
MNPLLLWVDDDRDEIYVVLRAFERAKVPVDVRIANDGFEALEALHAGGALGNAPLRPHVIFLDLHMPRIDGFDLLRALRRLPETRGIPIVVVSSSNSPDDIRRSYELGANSYLVKEPDAMRPGAAIADAARYWTQLNRLAESEQESC